MRKFAAPKGSLPGGGGVGKRGERPAVLSEQSSPIMERKPEVGSKVTETLQILFSGVNLVSRHFLSSYKLVLLLAGRRC